MPRSLPSLLSCSKDKFDSLTNVTKTRLTSLSHFMTLVSFYAPFNWRFFCFQGDIERDQWHGIGENKQAKIKCKYSLLQEKCINSIISIS